MMTYTTFYFEQELIVTNKLNLSTHPIFDEGLRQGYNFKIYNLPDADAMRITEVKLIQFELFLKAFNNNTLAFEAFVKQSYFAEEDGEDGEEKTIKNSKTPPPQK